MIMVKFWISKQNQSADPEEWVDRYGDYLMMCKFCSRYKKQLIPIRKFTQKHAQNPELDTRASLPAEAKQRMHPANPVLNSPVDTKALSGR
jgi:hypothetical protein